MRFVRETLPSTSDRSMFRSLGFAIAVALPTAAAQAQSVDRNYDGLVAGLAVSRVDLALGDASWSAKMGGQFDLGYRMTQFCPVNLPVLCWQRYAPLQPLRVTAHIAFLATDLRGMDPESDRYAYAHLNFGLRFTYALANEMRPYLTLRTGSHTAETVGAPNEVWNRVGSGTAFGLGLEIPLTPTGRGLDIGFTHSKGNFAEYEFMKTVTPWETKFRAVVFFIGWTGPFTGISLPWQ
jgi:hypothetical protein